MNDHILRQKIASDIAKRFVHLKESTARRGLLIKFINQPTTFLGLTELLNAAQFDAAKQTEIKNIIMEIYRPCSERQP